MASTHAVVTRPRRQGEAQSVLASPRRRRGAAQRRRLHWSAWAFLAPVVIYLLLFYGYPLLQNIDLSIRDYSLLAFVQGNAQFVGFANYIAVFEDPDFIPALLHTAVFTIGSIAFQFVIGMALAVFFYRNFRLSGLLRALFLVPWLLPLIVSATSWSWMLNSDTGVVNAVLNGLGIGDVHWLTSPQWALVSVTVANIWIGIPFNLVILYSGLQNIPGELYEAAALDGATGWQSFWRVTVPLLTPVSAITLMLGLVYTLKVFDIIWIMTQGGPGNASITLATWSYQLGFGSGLPQLSPGAAVGNLLIILALVFGFVYIFSQRAGKEPS